MRVTILVDSNQTAKNLRKKSSVSFFIETGNHKILYDLGANNAFAASANKLSVDISKIDTVVISGGFIDFGGGLKSFLGANSSAEVYVHQDAFCPRYTSGMVGMKISCGLDAQLKEEKQLVFTNNLYFLDDSIQLVSNIPGKKFALKNNARYFTKENGDYVEDSFNHEQYLLIEEDKKNILFLGNPNNGVANVIRKVESITCSKVDYVFTGFQLLEEAMKKEVNGELIKESLEELKSCEAKFYVSMLHGKEVLKELDDNLKDKITYFSQGDHITI